MVQVLSKFYQNPQRPPTLKQLNFTLIEKSNDNSSKS